jgi:hypothetical protein
MVHGQLSHAMRCIPAALGTGCYVGLSPHPVGSTALPNRRPWVPPWGVADWWVLCGPNANLCRRCIISVAPWLLEERAALICSKPQLVAVVQCQHLQ